MRKFLALFGALMMLFLGFNAPSASAAGPIHTPSRVKQAVVAAADPTSCNHGADTMRWSSNIVYGKPAVTSLTNWCLHGITGDHDQNRHVVWYHTGNLIVYTGQYSGGSYAWSSGTDGRGVSLTFSAGGRMQIKDSGGNVIWSCSWNLASGKFALSLTASPVSGSPGKWFHQFRNVNSAAGGSTIFTNYSRDA